MRILEKYKRVKGYLLVSPIAISLCVLLPFFLYIKLEQSNYENCIRIYKHDDIFKLYTKKPPKTLYSIIRL